MYFFCDAFYVFCICHIVLFVYCSLVVNCWKMADLLALLYLTFFSGFVSFQYDVLGQPWYLTVSFPDLCILPYFHTNSKQQWFEKIK